MFKLSNICRNRLITLPQVVQLVLSFLELIRVVIDLRELIQNYLIILCLLFFCSIQLGQHHGLYWIFQIQVHIVELVNITTDCICINLEFCLDRGEPSVKFVYLAIKSVGIGKGWFWMMRMSLVWLTLGFN